MHAAPVGHAVGHVDVLADAGLQPVAQLVHARFADRRVDVVLVERVRAEREDDRLRLRLAHRDAGDVERRRAIGLAHVAGPLRVEVVPALRAVGFRFSGLEALVARIDVALDHDLAVGQRQGIARARLHRAHRKSLDRAGDADLVAAVRHDRVAERAAGNQRARGRHAEAERQRHRLLLAIGLADHLPHVAARRDLERADVAPAEVHAVVAEVGAAGERAAGDAADAGADRQFLLQRGMPDRNEIGVHVRRLLDHDLLARRIGLRDLLGRDRLVDRLAPA